MAPRRQHLRPLGARRHPPAGRLRRPAPVPHDTEESPMSEQDHRPDDESPPTADGLPRRSLLKGTAGILAAGLFPAVHAQEKIVLRYLGTAVNQDKAIADKFKADTGIE